MSDRMTGMSFDQLMVGNRRIRESWYAFWASSCL